MDTSIRDLLFRLNSGPRFLILGQNSVHPTIGKLTTDESEDSSVLLGIDDLGDQGNAKTNQRSYDTWVQSQETSSDVARIAGFPWNGVYTSRIDSSIRELFETDWRRAILTTKSQVGRFSRNPSELLVRMLFGGLSLPPEQRPPSDIFSAAEAESSAHELMLLLASSVITPRGVVVIEGWGLGDWFTPKQLFTFVSKVRPGQAHLFSQTDEMLENAFVRTLVDNGHLITHSQSFAEYLAQADRKGQLSASLATDATVTGHLIPIGDSFVELDVDVWNQVNRSARPIDASLLEPFSPGSNEIVFQRFKSFLEAGEGAPPWKAIASDYKLTRDFESELRHRVALSLRDPVASEPIIVAGQTATGKSMALAALAIDLARSAESAVLHQSRRRDRPALADIDAFATWAERNGSPSTVLIWDGMVDPDEYYALQRQFRSRGRKIVIVGTAYAQEPRGSFVHAGPTISSAEAAKIHGWLNKYGIAFPHQLAQTDTSFLALLYRALPDTERGLRLGLSMEVRTVESRLEALSKNRSKKADSRLSAIAQALADAGMDLMIPSVRPDEELSALAFHERSTAEQLTTLILVASRRGVPLPLELAMRILGGGATESIIELVKDFDIFRWTEDSNGEHFLGTRTTLEAELLARQDLTAESEIEAVVQIISALRPNTDWSGGGDVQFIVDLIDRIGPQSEQSNRYSRFYLQMAEAFSDLRQSSGIPHPRLTLQEANLTREFVQSSQDGGKISPQLRIELLRGVQKVLEVAIEEADASPRTRLSLLVELASSLGAQIYEMGLSEERPKVSELKNLMNMIVHAASRAKLLDPENTYPVDVVAWSTEKAVESNVLDDLTKIDMLANAVASLESLDADELSPRQKSNYDRRQVELARLKGDSKIETRHLIALMNNGDPAAYYFLAKDASKAGVEGLSTSVRILREAPPEVRNDWRCAGLLLDLFWQLKTGKALLRGERQLVTFGQGDWQECLDLVNEIPNVVGYDRIRSDFVRGIASFGLGNYSKSKEIFHDLDRDSTSLGSRIIAKYLVSNQDGSPRVFSGSVSWSNGDGRRGSVWVEELSTDVNFIPLNFTVSGLRDKGEPMPKFHISFNMRGALAEPVHRLGLAGRGGRSNAK